MDYAGLSRFSHTIYCSEWVADLIPSGENWWARPGWIEHVIKYNLFILYILYVLYILYIIYIIYYIYII